MYCGFKEQQLGLNAGSSQARSHLTSRESQCRGHQQYARFLCCRPLQGVGYMHSLPPLTVLYVQYSVTLEFSKDEYARHDFCR